MRNVVQAVVVGGLVSCILYGYGMKVLDRKEADFVSQGDKRVTAIIESKVSELKRLNEQVNKLSLEIKELQKKNGEKNEN